MTKVDAVMKQVLKEFDKYYRTSIFSNHVFSQIEMHDLNELKKEVIGFIDTLNKESNDE